MRKFFAVLVAAFAALVIFAMAGSALPEGNPLRDAADGLRSIGTNMADNFGGGYGQLPNG